MSNMDARQPPRFVPTLTDVVAESVGQHALPIGMIAPEAAPVPVVQAVQPAPAAAVRNAAESEGGARAADLAAEVVVQPLASPQEPSPLPDGVALAHTLQEKVMARLDATLEERLRYALADMVQLHTQALYQAIREDVEGLVSASVHEAVAQELAYMRQQAKVSS